MAAVLLDQPEFTRTGAKQHKFLVEHMNHFWHITEFFGQAHGLPRTSQILATAGSASNPNDFFVERNRAWPIVGRVGLANPRDFVFETNGLPRNFGHGIASCTR